jgi:uncharacterized protein YbaA (DUF1428 family)
MPYVDGFVTAVPTAAKEAYRAYCQRIGGLFKEYGALEVVDCWGDDVPPGKLTSFPLAVQCGADETVAFGWTTWASRAARDEAWQKVMTDPRMQPGANPMPFDGKRMIYGGFEMISKA